MKVIIIPHAGEKYAGDARKSVFQEINSDQINTVVYIATLHHKVDSDKIYLLHNDNVPLPIPVKKFDGQEHSADWVYPELVRFFPKAKILIIAPGPSRRKYRDAIEWLTKMMNPNTLLIGTTDLTHYGEQFGNSDLFEYPQQIGKIKRESQIIASLIESPINTKKVHDNLVKNRTDGQYSVQLVIEVASRLGLTGRVTDYYDSHGVEAQDYLDRYTIDPQPVQNFVSYVSIMYSDQHPSGPSRLDIMLALGVLKSEIKKTLAGRNYPILIPKWSGLHKINNGVFVGTSLSNQVSCSYGQFEQSNQNSTAIKIEKIIGNCPMDAIQRWRQPYRPQQLDQITYKIEILEPMESWRSYPAKEAYRKFKVDGRHGMNLVLSNGRSATYLPSVASENQDWTVQEYLSRLAKKAGGKGDEWQEPDSIAQVYRTKVLTWDSANQKYNEFKS